MGAQLILGRPPPGRCSNGPARDRARSPGPGATGALRAPWRLAALLALGGLGLLGVPPASARPLPSLARLGHEHGPAVVRVLPAGRPFPEASGFLVGTHGVVVSAIPGARSGDGVVVELHSGERRRARISAVDDKSTLVAVEMLSVDEEQPFPSLLLGRPGSVRRADWLVSLSLSSDGGAPIASLGGVREQGKRRWLLDLPCPAGSPVLDVDGKVVAVATDTDGSHRVWAAPVTEVTRLLRQVEPKAPTRGAAELTAGP